MVPGDGEDPMIARGSVRRAPRSPTRRGGRKAYTSPVIRSYHFRSDGSLHCALPLEELRRIVREKDGVLWVDFEDPTAEEEGLLGPTLFGFHPLAIEDCVTAQSRPKIDDFEDYLFLVFHAWKQDDEGINLEEIDFFLSSHVLVSYHQEKRLSVDETEERVRREPRIAMGAGADMLLHQIIDRMVDRYTIVVDDIDERVEALEDHILARNQGGDTLHEVLDLRRDLQALFRTIRHQRDVVNSLAREGHRVISKKTRQFFRDVYDHVVRVHDTVEGLREQVSSARDAYLALSSNRMNEVMKGLSIVATVMLPLTFITGLYGMNFRWMPLLENELGFFITCGAMLAVTAGLLLTFRRKGWL